MRLLRISAAVLTLAVAGEGCHPPVRVESEPTPPEPAWDYCWWTLLRSPLPPDSVAARFQRGFVTAGFTNPTWTSKADTAWAHAGPTLLAGEPSGTMYEARAIAYRQGDSTSFRYFFKMTPPTRGSKESADALSSERRGFSLCSQVVRAAAVPQSRPGQQPNGRRPNAQDSLPIWTRVP